MSQPSITYSKLYSSLMAIGKTLKKTKAGKDAELLAVVDEVQTLLTAAKVENMDSLSPSARVAEAQVVMAQAVAHKQLNQKNAEAQCYLTAMNIWFEIETERRDHNYPTCDDALSKAVLCGAIACGVLLSQRPNPATSPSSRRLGLQPIPLPASKNITKCWAICVQIGTRLYNDFACFEMATDYFETAAQIVSTKPTPSHVVQTPTSNASGGGGVPSSSASVMGDGAASVSGMTFQSTSVPASSSVQSPTASTTGQQPTTSATAPSAAGGGTPLRSSVQNDRSFAFAMDRQASTTQFSTKSSGTIGTTAGGAKGGAQDVSSEANSSHPTATGAHQVGSSTHGSSAEPRTAPVGAHSEAGGARPGGTVHGGPNPDGADSTNTTTPQPSSTFVVSGHFQLYLTAMRNAIMISCVLKDYPRARSLSDDVIHHWRTVQAVRRGGSRGRESEAATAAVVDAINDTQGNNNNGGEGEGGPEGDGGPTSDQVLAVPPDAPSADALKSDPSFASAMAADGGGNPSHSPAASSAATPPPAPESTDGIDRESISGHSATRPGTIGGGGGGTAFGGGGAASTIGGGHPQQQRSGTANQPLRYRLPTSQWNASQLLASMVQEEHVVIHVHLVRFFLPLLLKEAPVVAQKALQELQDLAQLYKELEEKDAQLKRVESKNPLLWAAAAKPKTSSPSAAGLFAAGSPMASPARGAASNGNSSPSSSSQRVVKAQPFSRSLFELSEVLDIILDAYVHLPTSDQPQEHEEVLEAAIDDFSRLMSATSQPTSTGSENFSSATSTTPGESAAPSASRNTTTTGTAVVVGVGLRCRELNILCARAKEQIVSTPYDLISTGQEEAKAGVK